MLKSRVSERKSGASNPLTGTLQSVPGMPEKLKIFKVSKSQFWWVRVYVNGRYRTASLKTTVLRDARAGAKQFFIDVHTQDQLGLSRPKKEVAEGGFVAVGNRFIESQNVADKPRRYRDDKQRFTKELAPYFASFSVADISSADIGLLAKKLRNGGMSPATVNQYLIVLRKILKYAADNRLINSIPSFPKISGRTTGTTKRDYFEQDEYATLVAVIEQMAKAGEKVRGVPVTLEFKYLVQFMVNAFLRPSDLRVLRHTHVDVQINPQAKKEGDKRYLLLSHPATKTTDMEVVTMPAAHGIYQSLLKHQKARGFGKHDQFVFFPEYENRNTMMVAAGRIFGEVVRRAGVVGNGEKHTLYSLRHTAIMYRLLFGKDVKTLELARNARTSQAMIDKFYASRLTSKMAVHSLHSFK